ncbi:MAG: alanyl-tRNA editing protein [Spirochaetota bacterium]
MSFAATILHYYENPGMDRVLARVTGLSSDGLSVQLDATLFYPEGGGQPCDGGRLGGISLESVTEEEGQIVHRLALPLAAMPGDEVELELDRGRRRDHSEQHSAQHLLSGILFRDSGIATRSFHLGNARSTIDVDADLSSFGDDSMLRLDSAVDALVAEGRRFVIHRCPPEDIASLPLRKAPPRGKGEIRVVEIEGLDHSPCSGTHVPDAARLGLVRVVGAERYKGMTRLSFVAGGRAAREFSRLHMAVRDASRQLSAPPGKLAEEAGRLLAKLASEGIRSRILLSAWARLAVASALARGSPFPLVEADDAGPGGLEACLEALREAEAAGLVAHREGLAVGLMAGRGSVIPGAIPSILSQFGGKGGGVGGRFRGVFPDKAALDGFLRNALVELERT